MAVKFTVQHSLVKLVQSLCFAVLLVGGTGLNAQERIELADGSVLTVFYGEAGGNHGHSQPFV